MQQSAVHRAEQEEGTRKPPFWAVLEQLGHRRTAGLVSEEERFGTLLGRIDVPRPETDTGFVTVYFAGSSVYSLTPCTEEVARAVAKSNQPAPVHSYELPKALPAPAGNPMVPFPDDDEDDVFERDAEPPF